MARSAELLPRLGSRVLVVGSGGAGKDRVIRLTGRTAVAQWVHALSVSTQPEHR